MSWPHTWTDCTVSSSETQTLHIDLTLESINLKGLTSSFYRVITRALRKSCKAYCTISKNLGHWPLYCQQMLPNVVDHLSLNLTASTDPIWNTTELVCCNSEPCLGLGSKSLIWVCCKAVAACSNPSCMPWVNVVGGGGWCWSWC